ncbi:PLP-dependent aminotransferase family protein [Modestobacter sp. NPDC049651]|uniref:MocR-like pyridoxine biosynthesis transcription factor PdxR n=1 Tax=unclassified Modestobacter TaxID=2643866 RepID=UPI0033CEC7C0
MARAADGPAGSDFLALDVSGVPARQLTEWLVGEVRAAMADGRLPVGARLPATRVLAADLGVSRGVVVEVYQRLGDEGLVAGRVGSGTVVTRFAPPSPAPADPGAPAAAAPRWPAAGPGSPVLPPPPGGAEFDLSPGVPDLAAFPRAAWLRAERSVLDRATAADLGYGDLRGNPVLRGELCAWLARTRGVRTTPDQVLVVAGVAQALALLAQVLRARGTTSVALEDPGSRGARDQFAWWGMTTPGVPVDDEGLDVAALTATGARAVVVTPAHQFPTGVVLSSARRRALLGWAADGGLVVEDDYDAEHRYDRAPVPALHASAPGLVAYTGSTSKKLAPGLRLGWLLAPPQLQVELVAARHASDLGSPALPQLVLAELLASGELDRHLRAVRTRQRARRDALLAGLRAGLGPDLGGAVVHGVAAGLHLTLTWPEGRVDDLELVARAREAGVVVQPLSWHRHRPGPPGLVVGYAATSPDRLREAAARLAAVLR